MSSKKRLLGILNEEDDNDPGGAHVSFTNNSSRMMKVCDANDTGQRERSMREIDAATGSDTDHSSESISESKSDSDVSEKQCTVLRFEDQLTNDTLQVLERIFEEADEDGGGGLDMEEFRNAMRRALGPNLTDDEIDKMFMKVDTNCDGTVDWDEYLSYMLLEYREKDHMNHLAQEKTLSRLISKVPDLHQYQRHHESIIKLLYLSNVTKGTGHFFQPLENCTGGHYISVTKEGVVNHWSMDLKHRKKCVVEPVQGQKSRDTWIMDAVVLSNVRMMAVATTAATISFYDLAVGKFKKTLQIVDLEIAVTCMSYWFDPKKPSHAVLVWGDARGSIHALEFNGCDRICVLRQGVRNPAKLRVPLQDIISGQVCGTTLHILHSVHNDFVLRIQYHGHLNAFISCCRDHETALYTGDLHSKKKKNYFHINKGVMCFDYSRINNVIVTAGKDTILRVWNPYVPVKPVMVLQGHKSAVVHVVVNDSKEQIISISEEKDIHIFDMTTQVIIQSIFQKFVSLGARPITGMLFNQTRQALVLATNQLAIFEHSKEEMKSQELQSHSQAVNVVIYNRLFNQVVSGGADSTVMVWDLDTRQRHIQFQAHREVLNGEEVDIEITAMAFDPTLRRLITAARNGAVRLWNFNNGALLREMAVTDPQEVTSIVCPKHLIVTAGWNQRILIYVDSSDEDTVYEWPHRHSDDILCMAYYPPHILATADYHGNILIWSLETGCVLNHFNANENMIAEQAESKYNFDNKFNITRKQDVKTSKESSNLPSSQKSCTSSLKLPAIGPLGIDEMSLRNRASAQCLRLDESNGAVEKMVFLQSRPNTSHIASLFTSNSCGWIQAWSVCHKGGLCGQWNAAHRAGAAVLALTSDQHEHYLITGDSDGYIKVWNISDYCFQPLGKDSPGQADSYKEALKDQFPFLSIDKKARNIVLEQTRLGRPPVTSKISGNIQVPLLVASWRGHLQGITSLSYADKKMLILSCSPDCSVRLWTLSGQYLGIFGQKVPWRIPVHHQTTEPQKGVHTSRKKHVLAKKIFKKDEEPALLPPDVRKVASATTLKVLHGGTQKYWKLARHIVRIWLPMMRLRRHLQQKNKLDELQLAQEHQDVLEALETSMTDVDPISESPETTTALPKPPLQPILQKDKCIMGKHFRSGRKHQVFPELPEVRHFATQVAVYSSLPFHELDKLDELKPPQTILDIQERNRRMMVHMKEVSVRKTKTVGFGKTAIDNRSRSRQSSLTYTTSAANRWRRASIAVASSGKNLLSAANTLPALQSPG